MGKLLLFALSILSTVGFGQTKFASHGIKFTLPEGFKTTKSSASEFATFNRNNNLQIAFADGCHNSSKDKPDPNWAARLCFDLGFIYTKARYPASWASSPKDTVVNKRNYRWAEVHAKVGSQDYFVVSLLFTGKRYRYEILFSGHLNNKEEDLKVLQKILATYKETGK